MSETHFNVFIPSTGAGIQASSTCTGNVPLALCEVNGPATAQPIELIGEIIVSTYKHLSRWSETSRGPPCSDISAGVALKVSVSDIKSWGLEKKKKMTKRRRHSFGERVIPFVTFQVWLHK